MTPDEARDWARAYVAEHGYTKAETLARWIEHELTLMRRAPRANVDELRAGAERLRAHVAHAASHTFFDYWTRASDGVPLDCFRVAPLDEATRARLLERFPDTPDDLSARWLDGDACLGAPSGAESTLDYWARVCGVTTNTDAYEGAWRALAIVSAEGPQ